MHSIGNTNQHLLVDARPLSGARNGVTRFVEQLLASWPSKTRFITTLISNKPILSNASLPEDFNLFYDKHPFSRLPGTLWMNLRVPSIAHQLNATHFLGTQHVLPLIQVDQLKKGLIVHDLVFELYPKTMSRSNRIISRFFAPRSIYTADHIICVSKTTRSDLRNHFGDVANRAIVCYPGRTKSFGNSFVRDYKSSSNDINLLVVGSIEPRKNILNFIEAFLIASKRNCRLRLDLVSSDSWGNVMGDETWQNILCHPRICVHHRITDQLLGELYCSAKYLVFPSIYEGFGLPILEAVGRCAVIANDIPIFREIASKVEGIKLIDMQAEPIAVAESLLALFIENSQLTIADDHGLFSWDIAAKRIIDSMGLMIDGSS